MDDVRNQESHTQRNTRNDNPSKRSLLFFNAQSLSGFDSIFDEILSRGYVRSDSEHTISHIVNRIVASEEGVTEKEEVLLVSNDGKSTYGAVLVLGSVENVIVRVHNIPFLIEHELNRRELRFLSTLKSKESILNLVLSDIKALDELCSKCTEVTLGYKSKRGTSIEDGEDCSSSRVFVGTPCESVLLSGCSERHSLAHGGPVEVFVELKPHDFFVTTTLKMVHYITVKIYKGLFIWVSEVEREDVVLSKTLVFQGFHY
jgi:hypothetical protein